MIRRPPRSTLFPYTNALPISRDSSPELAQAIDRDRVVLTTDPEDDTRSEEHTSELQSRLHLVCRLLLEKKKKNDKCRQTSHKNTLKPNSTCVCSMCATVTTTA